MPKTKKKTSKKKKKGKAKLKIYNTRTRKKEIFKPIKKDEVRMYACGPTVYSNQHIGNMRYNIFVDILKRVLIYNGFNVKHISNVTDVGHLTSDADSGEDKIEKAAKKENKSAKEISEHYFEVFKKDLEKLNVLMPDKWTKATEHIKEQIELVKKLEEKGYTYKTDDGIYFDTSKFKDYGKLGNIKVKDLIAGKRVELGNKKNITDFALWKFSEEPGKRQQEWDSPWGIGFPGWHIECSAMSSKYLGKQFDIHTGGEDHIQVHHQNEIAQSEAAFGKKPWVNFWLHVRWLLFKGGKMAKSKGKMYTLRDLESLGYTPLAFRYFCLTAHYRKQLNFTLENMKNAQNSYDRLKNVISKTPDDKKINEKFKERFVQLINDDLDTSNAIALLWELLRDEKAEGKIRTISEMDLVFGLDLLKKEEVEIPDKVKKLVEEREKARENKDWEKADELREKIKDLGFYVNDTPEGPKVNKI